MRLWTDGSCYLKKRGFEVALIDSDFCDTKPSRLHSLETLYALGRVKEIYQRIEMQSEVGDEDLGVVAFAAFASVITNKEKNTQRTIFVMNG